MSGQEREPDVDPHVPVEAHAFVGAERAVRTGVVASASSDLGRRWTLVALFKTNISLFSISNNNQ